MREARIAVSLLERPTPISKFCFERDDPMARLHCDNVCPPPNVTKLESG